MFSFNKKEVSGLTQCAEGKVCSCKCELLFSLLSIRTCDAELTLLFFLLHSHVSVMFIFGICDFFFIVKLSVSFQNTLVSVDIYEDIDLLILGLTGCFTASLSIYVDRLVNTSSKVSIIPCVSIFFSKFSGEVVNVKINAIMVLEQLQELNFIKTIK